MVTTVARNITANRENAPSTYYDTDGSGAFQEPLQHVPYENSDILYPRRNVEYEGGDPRHHVWDIEES